MDGLDGVGLGQQQPRGPEAVAEVVPARLELRRQPAVEDDDVPILKRGARTPRGLA